MLNIKDIAFYFNPTDLIPVAFQKLDGGINSSVFKVKCTCGGLYVLKLFPNSNFKVKNATRFHREIRMYECAIENNISRTASLIYSSEQFGYAIYTHICGIKPTIVDSFYLDECIAFLHDINSVKIHRAFKSIGLASDAYSNPKQIVNSLRKRLAILHDYNSNSLFYQRLFLWLKDNFSPCLDNAINQFLLSVVKGNAWGSFSNIVSPSDVGLHNTLITQSCVMFIDFEYAGYDDLSKFAIDWVMQPHFPFDVDLEKYFLNSLHNSFAEVKSDWLNRYIDVKPLAFYRWILIQLKVLFSADFDRSRFEALVAYIKCCNEIHGFDLDINSLDLA